MGKLIFKIEYDGTNYSGWQIQPNALSIQERIEKAIFDLTGCKTNLLGAGRTDSGVHASGMIAHIDLNFDLKIPKEKIPNVLNAILPDDIRIIDCEFTESEFHSRHSAIARQYSYYIQLKPSIFKNRFSTLIKHELDLDLLFKSAEIFLGEHDFTAFSKNNPDTKSYVCKVETSQWVNLDDSSLKYTVKANRFVYSMVRYLVGAMIDVARGRIAMIEINKSLVGAERKTVFNLAKPNGLILERIFYPEYLDFF